MTAAVFFSILLTIVALVFTLSVLLLVLWQYRRTSIGRALIQFLASLALLQSGVFLTQFGLLADISDKLVEDLLTITLIGFGLVVLTSLALVLHAADMMRAAWVVISRAGVVGLVLLQPVFWRHDVLDVPAPFEEDLFGSPYTATGEVLALVGLAYVITALGTAWFYRRRIDAPLVLSAVVVITLTEMISLLFSEVRALGITTLMGGIVSGLLGYHLVLQFEFDPRTSQMVWLRRLNEISQAISSERAYTDMLSAVAESARQMMRTDVIVVLAVIGSDRLRVEAVAGAGQAVRGRHLRIGEGMAGRVMQTLQPMRISNYRVWNGRAADFEDMPYYASMSVPLIYNGMLVGVLNANETSPGRVYTDRDQMIGEFLAPQMAIAIAKARLEQQLEISQTYFYGVMSSIPAAMMIFDASGILREANPLAKDYLQSLFGDPEVSLTAIELASQAQDTTLTDALVKWTTDPDAVYAFDTDYGEIGQFRVRLLTVHNAHSESPELLLMMQTTAGMPMV
ncbi:MAG: GAF domain-containing protein [Chloroflexi bacterium]|nr:GAF domain-containing protein [Chloroflexota bacterium]